MNNDQAKQDLASDLAKLVATFHNRPYADVYAEAVDAVKAARAKVAQAKKEGV